MSAPLGSERALANGITHRTEWEPAVIVPLLLALTGAVIATVLLMEHLSVLKGSVSEGLFCGGAAGRFDCSQVVAHPSATLGGVPIALGGLVFYVGAVFLALGLLLLGRRAQGAVSVVGAWSAVLALLVDGWLLWVMLTHIGSVCLNCIATYVVNTLLFLSFTTLARRAGPPAWREAFGPYSHRGRKFGLVGGFLVGTIAVVAMTLQPLGDIRRAVQAEVAAFVATTQQPPEIDMNEFADAPSRGPVDAGVTIAVTGDFECIFCRALAASLESLRAKHPKELRVVFINSPVQCDCNPGITQSTHTEACGLAELAEAAALLGRFWQFHDYIYHELPIASATRTKALAAMPKIGLPPEDVQRILASGAARVQLAKHVALSNHLKLIATPSMVLNGYVKRGGFLHDSLEPIVDHMLESRPHGR